MTQVPHLTVGEQMFHDIVTLMSDPKKYKKRYEEFEQAKTDALKAIKDLEDIKSTIDQWERDKERTEKELEGKNSRYEEAIDKLDEDKKIHNREVAQYKKDIAQFEKERSSFESESKKRDSSLRHAEKKLAEDREQLEADQAQLDDAVATFEARQRRLSEAMAV